MGKDLCQVVGQGKRKFLHSFLKLFLVFILKILKIRLSIEK